VSTKIGTVRSPPLAAQHAVTVESTPPERATMTRPSADLRADLGHRSRRIDPVPVRGAPHTLRKLSRICRPNSVWRTSGWNWMPKKRRRSSPSRHGELLVWPAAVNHPVDGRRDRRGHPHPLHRRVPANSEHPRSTSSSAPPYSRSPAAVTSRREVRHRLLAVADTEHRHAEPRSPDPG